MREVRQLLAFAVLLATSACASAGSAATDETATTETRPRTTETRPRATLSKQQNARIGPLSHNFRAKGEVVKDAALKAPLPFTAPPGVTEATAILLFDVREDGAVVNCRPVKVEGQDIREAACAAILKSEWSPAQTTSGPTAQTVRHTINVQQAPTQSNSVPSVTSTSAPYQVKPTGE